MAAMKQKYPTVRISAETHKKIKEMAEEDCVSMSDVIAKAVEQYRRKRFWEHANNVWNEMMKDPEEREFWANEDAAIERTFWSPIDEPWEDYESDGKGTDE